MASGPQDATSRIPSIRNQIRQSRINKNKKILFGLGIFEIILGLTLCVLGAVAIQEYNDMSYYTFHTDWPYWSLDWRSKRSTSNISALGQGIWCGVVLIICGIAGTLTRLRKTKFHFCFNVFVSSLAAMMMVVLMIMSSVAAAVTSGLYSRPTTTVNLSIALAVLALLGCLIAIMHLSFSCICTSSKRTNDMTVMYTAVPQGSLLPVQTPNGHVMYYPTQSFQQPRHYQPPVQQPVANAPMVVFNPNHSLHQTASQHGSNPAVQPVYNTPIVLMPPGVSATQRSMPTQIRGNQVTPAGGYYAPVAMVPAINPNQPVTQPCPLFNGTAEDPPKYSDCVQAV